MYREAIVLLNQHQWAPALDLLRKVSAIDPNYQNVRANIDVVERELGQVPIGTSYSGPPAKKKFPGWGYGAIGGGAALVIVCGLGIGMIANGAMPLFKSATPTPTIVATEEVAEPTETVEEATATPEEAATEVPTEVPTEVIPEQGAVILEDSFADNQNSWFLSGSDIYLENGLLHLKDTSADVSQETWARTSPDLLDFEYEAAVTKVTGPEDFGYGILFQRTADFEYIFTVSGDGSYHLAAWVNNAWTDVIQWTSSDAVVKGDATNVLKVAHQGGMIQLSINGQVVNEIGDDYGIPGKIGLFVGAQGLELTCNHVLVTEPAGGSTDTTQPTPNAENKQA
jgi:hypothetical protein